MNTSFFKRIWEICKPVWEFLRPIVFPEFHRKITRRTLYTGIALLVGTPFLQWLIQFFLVAGTSTALGLPIEPLIDNLEGGQKWGFWLIIASLIYSVFVLWVQSHETLAAREQENQNQQNVLRHDHRRYETFLDQFSSDGALDFFVCHHNFDAAYRHEQSNLLHDFVNIWSAPEMSFQQREIAQSFDELFQSLKRLSGHLAVQSGPLSGSNNLYGIVDRSVHNDLELPAHVEEAVECANRLGQRIYTQRRDFIRLAEKHFATLPNG